MSDAPDVDVVVIGSGAAGLAAALSARQAGVGRVLVAESEGVVGGSPRLSGGLIMGAGTRYQKAHGIDDDGTALFHDYMQLNRWDIEASAVKRFCDEAGAAVEWMGDLGIEYYDTLVFGGDERVPRVHVPIGRGQAMVDVLAPALPGGRRRHRPRAARPAVVRTGGVAGHARRSGAARSHLGGGSRRCTTDGSRLLHANFDKIYDAYLLAG